MPASPVSTADGAAAGGSLAIFDPSLGGGDERRAMDTVIYFYPESVPDNLKMNHAGLCLAVAGLCETFSDEPLQMIRTDVGVTSIIRPDDECELWMATTVRPYTGQAPHSPSSSLNTMPASDAGVETAADHTAALMRTLLREAYAAFVFRFGKDAFASRPTVTDFFDRFCRRALPMQGENALARSRPSDALPWLLGLSTCHVGLSPAEFHAVRGAVAAHIPRCSAFVLLSDGAVVASTGSRAVTHAAYTLAILYGSTLPSFAAYPADGAGEAEWCHVVNCDGSHTFVALCAAAHEDQVAKAAAELFFMCDQFRGSRGAHAFSSAVRGARRPAAVVSLNFGSRTAYTAEQVRPSLLAALCGPVRELHERLVPIVEPSDASPSMATRRPLLAHLSRPRTAVLQWLDRNTIDVCCLVGRDAWVVVRHAQRRTVGMLFVDAVSLADIAESVDATTALFFTYAVPFFVGLQNIPHPFLLLELLPIT